MFLHFDKLSIDHDLVELRFHGRKQLVQNIAEREVGAVPLKESSPDLIESGAIKNQLRSDNGDAVRYVAEFGVSDPGVAVGAAAAADVRASPTCDCGDSTREPVPGPTAGCLGSSRRAYGSGVNEVRISPFKVRLQP